MAAWFYAVYRTEIIREAVSPFWKHSKPMVAVDCYVVLRALTIAGLGVDPGFRQILRYEESWNQRTLIRDPLGAFRHWFELQAPVHADEQRMVGLGAQDRRDVCNVSQICREH